jgi:TonB family protein
MYRKLCLVAALCAGILAAADLTGSWTGTATLDGNSTPLYLVLNQRGQELSGEIGRDATSTASLEKASLQGDRVTFQAGNTSYSLTFSGAAFYGEARTGNRVARVVLHPALNTDPRYTVESGRDTPPVLIRKEEPLYTEEARAAKLQGTVTLAATVGPDGRVTGDMRVMHSLGMGLDEKAIEAVRQWRFKPAYKNGAPVRMMVTIEVNFRL